MKTFYLVSNAPLAGIQVRVDIVHRTRPWSRGLIRMCLHDAVEDEMRAEDWALKPFVSLPDALKILASKVCGALFPPDRVRGLLRAHTYFYSVSNELLLRIAVAEYDYMKRTAGEVSEVTR